MAERERDERGRLQKGHKGLPGAGRKPGIANQITQSLRQQVLNGFEPEGVSTFVKNLRHEAPAAAAGLLARMIPPGDSQSEPPAGGASLTFNVTAIKTGVFVVNEEKYRAVTYAGAKMLSEFLEDGTPKPACEPFGLLDPDDAQRGSLEDGPPPDLPED